MVCILQPSSLQTTSPHLYYYCSSNQRRKQRQFLRQRKYRQQQLNQNKTGTLSFPKSYPTPLLTHHHQPHAQTKLQALDSVLEELETTLKNQVKVDTDIFASLLETCYHLRAVDRGMRIHGLIPTNHLRKSVSLSSRLLRLYAAFGRMEDAHQVFDEMDRRDMYAFPWNALMAGYAELGLYEDAMALYFQMEEEGVEPDRFTFPRVLKACGGIGSVKLGEAVHRQLVRLGFAKDGFVLNALVDMYAKCGDIVQARRVFDKVDCRDLVSWNSMLTGYIRHGLLTEALEIFHAMIKEGFEPDSVAISSILACGLSFKIGSQVHGWVVRQGIEWDLSIANSLIVVYANNGQLEQARWLFDHMPERDTISWNSIISAHSKDPRVLKYFEEMESAGALPDAITFVSLLSACAHLGLVKSGERLFLLLTEKYRITPIMEHYACMVNIYGRAGRLDEAYAIVVERMDFEAGPTVWGALLYGCYLHGNIEMGEIAAQNLFELEPDNEHNFELLMKVYSNAGRLEDAERVKKMMGDRGLGW